MDIATEVKEIILTRCDSDYASKVTMDAKFQEDLGFDSLDIVELIMDFEKKFNIKFDQDEEGNIRTVGDAVKYIESLKK
ncbi:MAG: acyl carrier protein [Ignavibacteriaceae bacterium]|nr:acyl carrier protein [Ignavibacteriaceae bacterium]